MENPPLTAAPQAKAELIGVADPGGIGTGFMIPVFRAGLRNTLLVQTVGSDGTIKAFEPSHAPGQSYIETTARTVSAGQPAYWAFAIDDELIIGNDPEAKNLLATLLDSRLSDRPLLGMEVSEFLGFEQRRDVFARAAFDMITEVSAKAGLAWRDLSVLTEDLRDHLSDRLGGDTYWPRKIIAMVEGADMISILGLVEEPNTSVFSHIREAVNAATRNMPLLYGTTNPFKIGLPTIAQEMTTAAKMQLVVDRPFDPERLRWDLRRRGAVDLEVIGWDSRAAFTAPAELPTCFLFDGLQRSRLDPARRRYAHKELVALALGTPFKAITDPTMIAQSPTRVIEIPAERRVRELPLTSRAAVQIQIATDLVLREKAGEIELPRPRAVLLTRRALHKSLDREATANLYDHAWSLRLVPWAGLRVVAAKRPPDAGQDEAVSAALFAQSQVVSSKFVLGNIIGPSRDGALLLPSRTRNSEDESQHRNNVARLFEALGWRVQDAAARSAAFEVIGSTSRFIVNTADEEPRYTLAEVDTIKPLGPLDAVSALRVNCRASPAVILCHLAATGELTANVRDILWLKPSSSNIFPVIAAQLRGMVRPRHDRFRSQFIGLVVRQAFDMKRAVVPDASILEQAIEPSSLGRSSHLIIERATWDGDQLRARIKLVASDENQFAPSGTPLAPPFVLVVGDTGPELTAPTGTH